MRRAVRSRLHWFGASVMRRTTIGATVGILILTIAAFSIHAQPAPTPSPQIRTIDTSKIPNRSQIKSELELLLKKKDQKVTEGLNRITSTPGGIKLFAKVRKQKVVDFVITYPIATTQARGGGTPELECNLWRRKLWRLMREAIAAGASGNQDEIARVENALIDALNAIEWCNSKGL